jgi:hypothetical protein
MKIQDLFKIRETKIGIIGYVRRKVITTIYNFSIFCSVINDHVSYSFSSC